MWYAADYDTKKALFDRCQKEWGRCAGKIYRDRPKRFDGPNSPIQVGWLFQKNQEYDDARWRGRECYLQETWVEVRDTEPEGPYGESYI